MVTCDGYAAPKPRKARKGQKSDSATVQLIPQPTEIGPPIDMFPSMSSLERHYFQHFLRWTTNQLSVSPSSTNFWLQYALPMSLYSEPVRHSMIAVGASHRLFMAHTVGYSHPSELKRLAIGQYNKAIATILPQMRVTSVTDLHCILVCCLLFISFEGLTGRYDELLRHLSAGITLFRSLPTTINEEQAVTKKLVEMFSQLGIESSNFMDDPFLLGVTEWYQEESFAMPEQIIPFGDLDEATYELRKLDLLYEDKPWHLDKELFDGASGPTVEDALRQWNARFEVSSCSIAAGRESEMARLQLRKLYWQMATTAFSSEEAAADSQVFDPFLSAAELVAAPLVAAGQPTFSLDGSLISGLQFVSTTTSDEATKDRAINMLRNLNRREGLLDSRDMVKLHEIAMEPDRDLSSEEQLSILTEKSRAPAGIPRLIERLGKLKGKEIRLPSTDYTFD
ncbi:hypothetical protein HJFPF1_12557 [Paramyrothecium foliicola]|nr:hypothetical protein HJFPF1_12557 [Paramyrothecium foliicola]